MTAAEQPALYPVQEIADRRQDTPLRRLVLVGNLLAYAFAEHTRATGTTPAGMDASLPATWERALEELHRAGEGSNPNTTMERPHP